MSFGDDSLRSLHLTDAFAASLARGAERPFLASAARRLSYGQADREVKALAVRLASAGVGAGGRVASILPNRPEAVLTLLAASRLGAAYVPLNPALTDAELTFQVRHAGVSAVVAVASHGGRDLLEWFEELAADSPEVAVIVAVDGDDLWLGNRVMPWAEAVAPVDAAPAAAEDADAPLAILYTSGTTGKPKGVVLPHRSLVGNARLTSEALGTRSDDVAWLAVPHFTVFGITIAVAAIDAGASLVLEERFEPAVSVERLAEERVTLCHGVPSMFALLLREPGFTRERLPALRSGIVAGSPVPAELVRRVRAVCDVEIAYGLTETGPTATMTRRSDPAERRETTVGRPLPGVTVRLVEETGGDGPAVSGAAELAVLSPTLMTGYDRMPSETRRVLAPDGALLTGDLASVDADGFVRIVGRRKELIIRGALNVVPREVEDVLRAHPAVSEVCVVGIPHDALGEMICACVVPTEGAIVTGEELQSFARERMADYKVPDLVRFLDTLPLTASGKVWRRELARTQAPEHTTT